MFENDIILLFVYLLVASAIACIGALISEYVKRFFGHRSRKPRRMNRRRFLVKYAKMYVSTQKFRHQILSEAVRKSLMNGS
jgi:hypothetical protein